MMCSLAGGVDTYPVATNILNELLATKTLVLSSRPKFIIQSDQAQARPDSLNFEHVDLLASNLIQEFGFKAQLSRSGHSSTIMQVVAKQDHVLVVVKTSAGQPYCLMADHFLAICDPNKSGGLACYEVGTVLWGLLQSLDRTNLTFQMTFMATNVPPAAVCDIKYVLQRSLARMTNASYASDDGIVKMSAGKTSVQIKPSNGSSNDPFGIAQLELKGENSTFYFSDFKIKPSTFKGVPQFSRLNLQELGLPLRELNASELNRLQLLIPDGFPGTQAEEEATRKLQDLITQAQGQGATAGVSRQDGEAGSGEGRADYLTSHQGWQPVICMPFILEPGEKQGSVFINPIVGVKITGVFADGKMISSVDAHTDYDGLNDSVTNIDEHFIYNLYSEDWENTNFWVLTSAVNMGGKEMSIRDFNIPKSSKNILIKYQIRHTDFSLGKEQAILSKVY